MRATDATSPSDLQALATLARDDKCVVAVMTGQGRYYSSGHDLGDQNKRPKNADGAAESKSVADSLADSPLLTVHGRRKKGGAELLTAMIIEFPKPLIAAVNGKRLNAWNWNGRFIFIARSLHAQGPRLESP